MWMLKLVIKPTSGLTFRRMPSSILHISTYPFLPPTTMSGFLRRLKMLETGHLPETAVKDPDYYALPPQLCTLGAYPQANEYRIHTTKRQGIRSFNHNAFSRIVRHQSTKEVYQLHTWEYLFTEKLVGYVVSEDEKLLSQLKTVKNFGCKIGKEGYAFVDQICDLPSSLWSKLEQTPIHFFRARHLLDSRVRLFHYTVMLGESLPPNTPILLIQNRVPLKGLSHLLLERFTVRLNLIIIPMGTFISRSLSLMNCGKENQMVKTMDIIEVGRVFFEPDSGPDVEKIIVLTLESHVENVVTLVKNFQRDFYPAFRQHQKSTRDLLIRAAEKHDDAKPETFRVTYRNYKENGRKSLGYSFAGHRFRVSDENRYVELLIRMHHEFSVEGIVKAQAELKTEKELSEAKF